MKELFINRARCCAVTGHRVLQKNFDKDKLKLVFLKLIDAGYDTFLIGMALGFDTLCFNILEELRKEKKIKIIACVPCKNQDYKFNITQEKEYRRMLSQADDAVYIEEEYSSKCMQKRNEYMVDNSSCLIAYLKRNFGGTANTVKYAEKKGVYIINI